MAALRLVLDTNVLISGIAYPSSLPGQILSACRTGELKIVLSRYILDEMRRVLARLPRVSLTSEEIRELVDSFLVLGELAEPTEDTEPFLRDRKDQPVLGTLKASKADYLITGDKDLLALAARFPILSPAEFWKLHHS